MRDTLHPSRLLRWTGLNQVALCSARECSLFQNPQHILPPFLVSVINGRSIWFLLSLFPFLEVHPLAIVFYHNVTTVTKCFLLFRASRPSSFGQRSRFCFMRVFRLIF